MKYNSIYIDDTGTPEKSQLKFDPGDWTSFVSVIIEKVNNLELVNKIELLKNKYSVNEFHFNEIFSGKGEFKKFSRQQRINIFEDFSELYKKHNCPIYIQSLTEDDIIRNRISDFKSIKKDGFNFSNNKHLCLWLLLVRLANEYNLDQYEKPFEIIIDAGKQKDNTFQKIHELKDFSIESKVFYRDSNKDNLLQFIDFIAYTLNRIRWIQMNNKITESDIDFLKFASRTQFNAPNMKKELIELESIGKESMIERYENVLNKAYKRNGNLTEEEVKTIKNQK